jgi:NTE family protein
MTGELQRRPLAPGALGVGLVLSGGGAKGAYQVGVVRCLSESDVRVSAIAGASIGALNGAVTASAPTMAEAAKRLEMIWRELANAPPVEAHGPTGLSPFMLAYYLSLLIASGERVGLRRFLDGTVQGAEDQTVSDSFKPKPMAAAILRSLDIQPAIVTDPRLASIIADNISGEGLSAGLPLYVSAFRSRGTLLDVGWALAGALGIAETPNSEFIHVQQLPSSERRNAILASAAIPLIFEARRVAGGTYADGGIGGLLRVQGNTPITPLLEHSKCRVAIVTHLQEGSLFDRHSFPEATIIEIRPSSPITRVGGLRDLLALDSDRIAGWIEQGYEDTKRHLTLVSSALETVARGRGARAERDAALRSLGKNDSDH